MRFEMWVYLRRRLIAVETNEEFAIPYWTKRKRVNPRITWKFKS